MKNRGYLINRQIPPKKDLFKTTWFKNQIAEILS